MEVSFRGQGAVGTYFFALALEQGGAGLRVARIAQLFDGTPYAALEGLPQSHLIDLEMTRRM